MTIDNVPSGADIVRTQVAIIGAGPAGMLLGFVQTGRDFVG